jgi:hypothetical protein
MVGTTQPRSGSGVCAAPTSETFHPTFAARYVARVNAVKSPDAATKRDGARFCLLDKPLPATETKQQSPNALPRPFQERSQQRFVWKTKPRSVALHRGSGERLKARERKSDGANRRS